MSRAINSVKSLGFVLAALCIAGAPLCAQAATVTVNLNLGHASLTRTDIAVDSSTPQFFYESFVTEPLIAPDGTVLDLGGVLIANFGSQNSGRLTPGPGGFFDPSLFYGGGAITVSVNHLSPSSYLFIHLKFLNGLGQTEYGYAQFNSNGDLEEIRYEQAAAVATPLPATSALFISGVAMFGYAARRRKRLKAAAR